MTAKEKPPISALENHPQISDRGHLIRNDYERRRRLIQAPDEAGRARRHAPGRWHLMQGYQCGMFGARRWPPGRRRTACLGTGPQAETGAVIASHKAGGSVPRAHRGDQLRRDHRAELESPVEGAHP